MEGISEIVNPTPLLKVWLLGVVCSWVLSILKDEEGTTLLGNLFQRPDHISQLKKKKKVFFPLMFEWSFLYFSLCPLLPASSPGTTGKSLAQSSLVPSSGI